MVDHPALAHAETYGHQTIAVLTQSPIRFLNLARMGLGPQLTELNVTACRLRLQNGTEVQVYNVNSKDSERLLGLRFTVAFKEGERLFKDQAEDIRGPQLLEVLRVQ